MKGILSAFTALFLGHSATPPTPTVISKPSVVSTSATVAAPIVVTGPEIITVPDIITIPENLPGFSVITAQTSGPAKAVTTVVADDVVKNLQKFYDDAKDFSADFKQVYTYKAYGRTQKSKGKVFFKKAGKMRWNYSKPTQKYFITDGTDFWAYEPEEKQAYKVPLEDSQVPVVLTFLSGKGKLSSEFTAKLLTADPRATATTDYVLELTPKKSETDYKKVIMVVDGSVYSLKEVYVYDPVDNENHLSFTNLAVNKGISDSQFTFTPPSDVKIVNPPTSEPTE